MFCTEINYEMIHLINTAEKCMTFNVIKRNFRTLLSYFKNQNCDVHTVPQKFALRKFLRNSMHITILIFIVGK